MGAGLSTVLANVQLVLVALAAWAILGERPGARVLAAVPIVLVGVVLISGVLGEDAYGDDPVLGVVFGLGTAVAYAGWLLISVALPRVPAALTSIVLTLQPVLTVALGVVLLDESPSELQLAGIAVVVGGILLATVGRRRPASAAEPRLDLT